MSRSTFNQILLIVISVLTLGSITYSILLFDVGILSTRFLELSMYAIVTAFALIFSVPLSKSELSIAHAIGLMALLSLPETIIPAMTIAIFLGGLVGGSIRAQVSKSRQRNALPVYIPTVHIATRVTLAYFAASMVYINIGNSTLPINNSADISANAVPLTIAILTYLGVYSTSFLVQLRLYERLRDVVPENLLSLTIILLLPVPFALMGASIARTDESVLFFSITIIGALLIIFGLFALNRSQQQLRRQLDEMRSISMATQAMRGHLDLNGLLRTTYVQVSHLMEIDNFTVALYDEIEMRMTFPLVIRNSEELEIRDANRLPSDFGLIEHVMNTSTGLLIEEDVAQYTTDLGLRPPDNKVESWLGVPLVSGDTTFGAFVVQSYDQRHLNQDDLRVLNIIVASTAIAIENARLYRQKSIRAEQLATLNQVTALLTGTLAPNTVLDMVVSAASTIAESNAVAVYLFREDDNQRTDLVRSAGLSDTFLARPPQPSILPKMLAESYDDFTKPSSLLVSNLDNPDVKHSQQQLSMERKRALIEQPLIYNGERLGVLILYYDKPQQYHPEQIDIIQAFATQASQAISNAQKFASADAALEQRVEQLYALAAMGRLLNASMEASKIYEIVLTYATDATKAERGFVAVYQSNRQLDVPTKRGYPDDMFQDADFLEQGLIGHVLTSGQPQKVSDTRKETGYLPLVASTRSLLAIPIMKGRDILGAVVLESDHPDKFKDGDGHFVAQIANQAVIAVDNTLLFHRIREARDNMQVILDAMREGVILIDENQKVALANPKISLIDLNPDDILGQDIEALLNNQQFTFAEHLGFNNPEMIRQLVNQRGDDWQPHALYDYEIHNEDIGVRYIQREIIPVRDEDNHVSGIMLVFYNKSEEKELASARESLSQMIVHDLRSPLTAVTTSLRLLQQLVPEESSFAPLVKKTTATSQRAIRKVLSRVDSLLDISKMESGSMHLDREPTSIEMIANNVIGELTPLADELNIQIISTISDNLPSLDVDADKIERMMLNLVDNALKYSPDNSEVRINAMMAMPGYMRIEVADAGPGIPDDYKKRLFDRFVQIEGRRTVRGGVGLGLTFCKLVTEAHGGDIWVADNQTGGSIFKATLPTTSKSVSS